MVDEPIIRDNFADTPSIRGTRLTVYNIMDFHFAGNSAQEIADASGITSEEARAAMQYIDEHKAELMPRYLEILERNRQGNPPHIRAIFDEVHERFMRKVEERRRHGTEDVGREAGDARAAG